MNEEGKGSPFGGDRWVEALTWHDTLREADEKDLSDELLREWQHWYGDAENRRIFDNVSRLLADRSLYRDRSLPEELDADGYDPSVPIAAWRKTRTPPSARKMHAAGASGWRRLLGRLAAATIAVIGMLAIFRSPRFRSSARRSPRRDRGC